jgi:hypothetical protein
MGLPTVAMGDLGLVIAPVQAAAILVIPSLVTNVWQLVARLSVMGVLRRLATRMIFIAVGTGIGISFLTSGKSPWPSLAHGFVLAAYVLIGLFFESAACTCAERIVAVANSGWRNGRSQRSDWRVRRSGSALLECARFQ